MLARPPSARLLAVALALVCGACDSGDPPPAASVSAAPQPAPAPAPPPTEKKPTSFRSEDGAALSGDLYLASPQAPVVVLVHRLFGDRSEFGPLIERLRRSEPRFSLLAFDLRGHGSSKEPSEKSKRKPGKDDKRELAGDVSAAIAHALQQSGNKARGVVLVGSSFGATLASLVAFEQAKVIALALISPGAAIRGVDLYRPYSEVRNLPTFIAGAEADTVAKDPLDALARMAQKPTLKRYPGARHGAQFLGEEQAALWKDLEVWLASVHAQAPVERRSLYYAPGKEPKAKKQPATPRARGGG